MKKVLLVYDDFSESNHVQGTLKKIGFDVAAINNETLLGGQIINFNPDVVIAKGGTQKVHSLRVSARLKEQKNFHGRVILIMVGKVRPSPQDLGKLRMDVIMEAPVTIENILVPLAKLTEQNEFLLLEKLRRFDRMKMNQKDAAEAAELAKKKAKMSRAEKYADLTKDIKVDPKTSSHSRAAVKEAQKKMDEGVPRAELDAQDRLKRDFASALFSDAKPAAAAPAKPAIRAVKTGSR